MEIWDILDGNGDKTGKTISGHLIPPTLNVIKLAKLYNVTTDYILCYELNIEKINIQISKK